MKNYVLLVRHQGCITNCRSDVVGVATLKHQQRQLLLKNDNLLCTRHQQRQRFLLFVVDSNVSDISKQANSYQILFCAIVFFHKLGFANPSLWKKQTIILLKTSLYVEIGKCYSY